MKLGIPVINEKGLDSTLSEHFGRTPFYLFVDIVKGQIDTYDLVRNPFEQHGPGQIPSWVQSIGVDTMIVSGIGTRAIGFFTSLGITVVKATGDTAKDCIDDYLSGKTDDSDPACNHDHHHDHDHHSEDDSCKKKYGIIALTVKDKSLDSQIDERFARGKIIAIVNSETGSIEYLDNNPMICKHKISFRDDKIFQIDTFDYIGVDWNIWQMKRDSLTKWVEINHPELVGFIFDMTKQGGENYLKAIELFENR